MKERLPAVSRWYLGAVFAAMFLYGAFQALYGAGAVVIRSYFHLSQAQFGSIVTAFAVGGLAVTIGSILLGERFGKLNAAALALLVLAAGAWGTLLSGNVALFIVSGIVAAIGYTLVDLLLNATINDVFEKKKKVLLPTLHMFFALGAMVGPLLVQMTVSQSRPASFRTPFFICSVALVAVLVVYSLSSLRMQKQTPVQQVCRPGAGFHILTRPCAYLIMGAALTQIFFQKGIQTWISTYMMDVKHAPFDTAVFSLTLFFAGTLGARILSPWLFAKLSIPRMTVRFTILSGACFTAVILSRQVIACLIFLVLAGLFHGTFCAAIFYIAGDIFKSMPAGASGIVMLAISVSSMAAPGVLGILADKVGLTFAMATLPAMMAVCTVLLVLTFRVASKSEKYSV